MIVRVSNDNIREFCEVWKDGLFRYITRNYDGLILEPGESIRPLSTTRIGSTIRINTGKAHWFKAPPRDTLE
jgi:hypothetical protein